MANFVNWTTASFGDLFPEDNANAEAVANLVDQYQTEIKRARALNTDPNNPNYLDRFNAMASCEDLIFPVWGSSDNLTVETLGGETDIRWIADIDKLENHLITALKVPKQLLAGFSGEGGGGFEGGTALERMDIRFARQARRVQRTLINGITRMAQIHLAGFSGEGGGGFEGGTALERMDIRFGRQSRRVQRTLINGITRMAQIHLA